MQLSFYRVNLSKHETKLSCKEKCAPIIDNKYF